MTARTGTPSAISEAVLERETARITSSSGKIQDGADERIHECGRIGCGIGDSGVGAAVAPTIRTSRPAEHTAFQLFQRKLCIIAPCRIYTRNLRRSLRHCRERSCFYL